MIGPTDAKVCPPQPVPEHEASAAAGECRRFRRPRHRNPPITRPPWPVRSSHPSPGVTAPRIIVPGATTAITRRTTMRKAFLAPWHSGVGQAWLYSLALAQKHTEVAVHHAARVVTHHHLTVTPEHDNLPRFTQIFHHELSCAINTLLAHQRYDQPGELFDSRATHMMRLCDDAAQSTHLNYEYLNTVAAGLVSRPEHMPGFAFDFDLWLRGHIDVRRPDFYFSDKQPEVLRLQVTPPPLLLLAFDGDMHKLVYQMRRLAEQGARELRAKRSGPPLGARAVTRLHPWSEPRTLRETRGKRLPTFRIGARGIVGHQAHVEAALETRHYRDRHEQARIARKGGDLEREFPFGTYQMRVQHGVPIADPDLGTAIVTRPGPTLRDVQLSLEHRPDHGLPPQSQSNRLQLIDSTREALIEEADAICQHAADGMDFRDPQPTAARRDSGASDDRSTDLDATPPPPRSAAVRHRFDKRRSDGSDSEAPRVVTLRDRRRGRPPGTRHGNDPPA